MSQRVHYRGSNPYRTPGNRVKLVKNPSGKLVFRRLKKTPKKQLCGDCKQEIQGVIAARPADMKRAKKCQKTVNRPYGGTVCAKCVEGRILKSFLKEEQEHVREKLQ